MASVLFFGYGANRSKERLQDILGKKIDPGYGAILQGYVLCVQKLNQIPEKSRKILEIVWGDDFRCYTLKRGKGVVAGIIWELSEVDFTVIKEWEQIGIWRKIISIDTLSFEGKTVGALTGTAPEDAPICDIVDGLNYQNNLNNEGKKISSAQEYKIDEIIRLREKIKKMQIV